MTQRRPMGRAGQPQADGADKNASFGQWALAPAWPETVGGFSDVGYAWAAATTANRPLYSGLSEGGPKAWRHRNRRRCARHGRVLASHAQARSAQAQALAALRPYQRHGDPGPKPFAFGASRELPCAPRDCMAPAAAASGIAVLPSRRRIRTGPGACGPWRGVR